MSKHTSTGAINLLKTVERLRRIDPVSREDMISRLREVVGGGFIEFIDSHNTESVLFIFASNKGRCLLKAEFGPLNSVAKEAAWYKTLEHYEFQTPPCLAAFVRQKYAFVVLAYLDGSDTIDELVAKDLLSNKKLIEYLNLALERDEFLFSQSTPIQPDRKTIYNLFVGKYEERREASCKYPYLKRLFESSYLRVNGSLLHPLDYYLSKINDDSSLYNYLTPDEVGLIHGDLHCGNILVRNDDIYCVDPNGELQMPLEYDYGKLFHSIHGCYESIMAGEYLLEEDKTDGSHHFDLRAPEVYKDALQAIHRQLTDQQYLRGLYAEAMHFATMLPHHATNQAETTALFIRSTQIFDELLNSLGVK